MALPDWSAWIDTAVRVLAFVGGVAGAMAAGVFAWAKREFVTIAAHERDHDAITNRLVAVERECAAIAADVDHLPDHDDIANLLDRVGQIEGSVRALAATVEGLREVIERVERPLNVLVSHHLKGAS